MFRFEDIIRLSSGDISKITKEVDQDDLIIAMKNASAELKKAIYSTMSKRAVEALEEQLGFLGPKRLSEIEAAQDRVIQIVRELEEDEEIILDTEVAALSYSKSISFPEPPALQRYLLRAPSRGCGAGR